MNDFPLITAAVPVFGTEQLLADCIQSIFEQDYPNLEIIITDDASCGTDSGGRTCAQIAAALTEQGKSWNPPRTVYYQRHQENRGLVESRRDGTEAASGQYMFFADSDDLLPPAAVSTLYQEARQSGADIVHGCAELLGHTGLLSERARRKQEQRIAQIYPGLLDGADVFDGYLRLHNHSGFLWGKLYRRDLLAAAFSPVETPVGVVGNINVGLDKLFARLAYEPDVLDVHAPLEPLLLVEGLYLENVVGDARVVEVVGSHLHGVAVGLHHFAGVGVHEGAVALEVDESVGGEYLLVERHEAGRGEPLAHLLHLRVGEGNPDFRHLARSEEAVDQFDVGPQEGYILYSLLERLFGAAPHAGPLDVDADKVLLRKATGQPYGIFALAATQLEHDGVVVLEEGFAPFAPHLEPFFLQQAEGVLEHVGVSLQIVEFFQFIFSHSRNFIFVSGGRLPVSSHLQVAVLSRLHLYGQDKYRSRV